jgi:hypothetical protein
MKKINNRTKQNEYNTYKNENEITEAIYHLNRFDVPVSVIKILEAFRKVGNQGATQASVKTLYEMADVSKTSFYETVKPFLDTFFGERLIKIFPADRKWSRDGKTKVRSSEYKVLQPLKKIIYLVNKKLKELEQKRKTNRESLFHIPGPEVGPEDGPEEEVPSPCESMSEDGFSTEQYKSFRKNLSEKDSNKLNITNNFIDKNLGKIKIKTSIKNYLNEFPLFRDFHAWTESKRYEIAKTIQLAIIKTKTDIEEVSVQFGIKNAIKRLLAEYQDKPLNEFLRLLYTFVFNELNNDQEDEPEAPEDEPENNSDEPLSLWDEMKPTFQHMLDNPPIDPRPHQERVDEINRMLEELDGPGASKQDLDDLGVY